MPAIVTVRGPSCITSCTKGRSMRSPSRRITAKLQRMRRLTWSGGRKPPWAPTPTPLLLLLLGVGLAVSVLLVLPLLPPAAAGGGEDCPPPAPRCSCPTLTDIALWKSQEAESEGW